MADSPANQNRPVDSPEYLLQALCDAERLLKYAAESGIAVDPATRDAVLDARAVSPNGWTEPVSSALLAALTDIARLLKPVSAASLHAFHNTRPTIHQYRIWAVILAVIILPASIATFVSSAISNALKEDITTANALAVKLRTELGSDEQPTIPAAPNTSAPGQYNTGDVVLDLQEYASSIRLINRRAFQLSHFVFPIQRRPDEDIGTAEQRRAHFELPIDIPSPIAARDNLTFTYQDVRYYAQSLIADCSVFYGALTTCILPVLYALLGTCAYLIRDFEDQMARRTFTPSAANSARFLIAGIGGAVVGLFNNLTVNQQASIPPLAMAFLVGYAVDVFFAFLEGLLRAFTKTSGNASPAKTS